MKIYGVLGYPVKHSLSPSMHNAAFKALKIDAEYRFFEVAPSDLNKFFDALMEKGICGLNVTVPYKERVISFLSSLSEEAKLIGAVNTIKISGKGLEGFNTDGEGFLKHLKEDLKFDPAGKNIAVIGAGGAAKAVSVYLSRTRPARISIYDIDTQKAKNLVHHLKENFSIPKINAAESVEGLDIRHCELLINATPVGMKESDPCIVNEGLITDKILVYDLIYNPKETKLLKLAREKGARVSNGLGMLLYQGMVSFEFWTGRKAPKAVMQDALRV